MTSKPLLLALAAFLTSLYAALNPAQSPPPKQNPPTLESVLKALDEDVQKTRDPQAMREALDRQFDVMLTLNSRLTRAAIATANAERKPK